MDKKIPITIKMAEIRKKNRIDPYLIGCY